MGLKHICQREYEGGYRVNLEISEKSGDLQGICMMNSNLSAFKIEEAKNFSQLCCGVVH